MRTSKTLALALGVLSMSSIAASAQEQFLNGEPLAVSIGVTFGDSYQDMHYGTLAMDPYAPAMSVETLSASVATGGRTAVANSTAVSTDGFANGATSNAGATEDGMIGSRVHLNEQEGFTSQVMTNNQIMHPYPYYE